MAEGPVAPQVGPAAAALHPELAAEALVPAYSQVWAPLSLVCSLAWAPHRAAMKTLVFASPALMHRHP